MMIRLMRGTKLFGATLPFRAGGFPDRARILEWYSHLRHVVYYPSERTPAKTGIKVSSPLKSALRLL